MMRLQLIMSPVLQNLFCGKQFNFFRLHQVLNQPCRNFARASSTGMDYKKLNKMIVQKDRRRLITLNSTIQGLQRRIGKMEDSISHQPLICDNPLDVSEKIPSMEDFVDTKSDSVLFQPQFDETNNRSTEKLEGPRYKSVLCQPLIGNDFTLVSETLESFNDPKYSRHYIAVDRIVVDCMNEERLGPSEICKDFTADTGAHLLDFRGIEYLEDVEYAIKKANIDGEQARKCRQLGRDLLFLIVMKRFRELKKFDLELADVDVLEKDPSGQKLMIATDQCIFDYARQLGYYPKGGYNDNLPDDIVSDYVEKEYSLDFRRIKCMEDVDNAVKKANLHGEFAQSCRKLGFDLEFADVDVHEKDPSGRKLMIASDQCIFDFVRQRGYCPKGECNDNLPDDIVSDLVEKEFSLDFRRIKCMEDVDNAVKKANLHGKYAQSRRKLGFDLEFAAVDSYEKDPKGRELIVASDQSLLDFMKHCLGVRSTPSFRGVTDDNIADWVKEDNFLDFRRIKCMEDVDNEVKKANLHGKFAQSCRKLGYNMLKMICIRQYTELDNFNKG